MISIILPTYNRFDIVRETVSKMLAIQSDIIFEIIVVNDGEPLPFTVNDPRVTILKNPKRGAAAARNHGAAAAKYPFLFFIDDDMWITAQSLAILKKLADTGFFNANCALLNWQYPDTLIQQMSGNKIGRYLLKANYHTLEGRLKRTLDKSDELIRIHSIGSGSFAISADLFNQSGKYNEEFLFQGEDIELSDKLNRLGVGIFLVTETTCFHNQKDRLDITEFVGREYRGHFSQFSNKDNESVSPDKLKQLIFTLLIPFNSLILWFFRLIPNNRLFDFLTFRTIGILSSIAYFRAFYDAAR